MIADIILVIAAALFVGVYVSWRAGRIDRLHARVDMARVALDVTLLRRSSVAQELATSGLLDPATSLLLAGAVLGTRQGGSGGPGGFGGMASPQEQGGSGGDSFPRGNKAPRPGRERPDPGAARRAFSQPGLPCLR